MIREMKNNGLVQNLFYINFFQGENILSFIFFSHSHFTFIFFRFAGSLFAEHLEESVKSRKKRGKKSKQIRYIHYCIWARGLYKKEVGPENSQYKYPPSVLSYIRELAPGDIVGEIRDDAFDVTIKEFCEALDIPLTNELSTD